MIDFEKVILDLERTRLRPQMYFDPVTPESLMTYLSGIERGIRLLDQKLTIDDYVDAGQTAIVSAGARPTALHPMRQWRQEGLEDKDIIEKMFDVEIEYYRLLSVAQKQKQE